MKLPRRRFLHLAAGVVGLLVLPDIAWAQAYPTRPIRMVVPYPAGEPISTLAGVLAENMRKTLSRPVVVEHVAGAGGSIAVARVARSAPDGYTLSFGQWTSHVAASLMYPVQYDVLHDLEPISVLATGRLWIVTRNDFPATDLKELIAWLKANSDKAPVATVGVGRGADLCGIYQSRTTARFQLVTYRRDAPTIQDLLGGKVDVMCDQLSNSLHLVRTNQLKAYAVMANFPSSVAPEVPASGAAGVPGAHAEIWSGLWAPKRTPPDVIKKLNAAVVSALGDPAVEQRFADIGQTILARNWQTPEALRALHKADFKIWSAVIKPANN
jgi:tripartite-type tricarboxylate transporter receptor subunit TctC